MNTKIVLAGVIISSLAIAGVAGASFGGFGKNSIDKEAMKTMTSQERQVFMEDRKAEMQEKRESHSSIMDKLLNSEELSSDEKAVLEEMKAHRADKSQKMGEYEKGFGEKRGMMRGGNKGGKMKGDCMNRDTL